MTAPLTRKKKQKKLISCANVFLHMVRVLYSPFLFGSLKPAVKQDERVSLILHVKEFILEKSVT
jgi:hypothetical protein